MFNKRKYKILLKICLLNFTLAFLGVKGAISMMGEEDKTTKTLPRPSSSESIASEPEIELISFETRPEFERTNLLTESHLITFIQKYLVEQQSIPETSAKKALRITTRGLGSVLGGLAGVPYFEVGKEAGGRNQAVAWIVGISNTVGNSGIGAWSYFNLLEIMNPKSLEEVAFVQKSRLKIPAHILSHLAGLAVAVPTGYMGIRYNTYKWLASISYVLDYSLKTNGFITFYETLSSRQTAQKDKKIRSAGSLLELKQTLASHLLQKTIPSLMAMQEGERSELISALYRPENLTAQFYLNTLLRLPPPPGSSERETPDTWKKGYPKKALVCALSISPVINALHNGYCAYAGWKVIYDNMVFTIPMAMLTAIPVVALELKSTITTAQSLYDVAFYRISKQRPQLSLEKTLYPELIQALPFICMTLAGVTSYVGRFMVIDILEDILPKEPSLFLSAGGFLGPFIFASYANYSLIKDCLLGYTRTYGSENKKRLAQFVHDIQKLAKLVQHATTEELEKFFQNIDLPRHAYRAS